MLLAAALALAPALAPALATPSLPLGPIPQEAPETSQVVVEVLGSDGQPAAGAEIHALPNSQFPMENPKGWTMGTTNHEGKVSLEVPVGTRLRFDAIDAGATEVATVWHRAQYQDSLHEMTISLGAPERKPVGLVFLDDISREPVVGLKATVRESDSFIELNLGRGRRYITLDYRGKTRFTSDESGRVQPKLIEPGEVHFERTLDVWAEGHVATAIQTSNRVWTTRVPPVIRLLRAPDLRLAIPGLAPGSIVTATRTTDVDDLSSDPPFGRRDVTVALPLSAIAADTFQVAGVPDSGWFKVAIAAPGGTPDVFRVKAPSKGQDGGQVILDTWKEGRVAGKVTTRSGLPMAGYCVVLDELMVNEGSVAAAGIAHREVASTTTDDLGRYAINDLPPANYRVTVRAKLDRPLEEGSFQAAPPRVVAIGRDTAVAIANLTCVPELRTRGRFGVDAHAPITVIEHALLMGFAGNESSSFPEGVLSLAQDFVSDPYPPGLLTLSYMLNHPEPRSWIVVRVDAGTRNLQLRLGPTTTWAGKTVKGEGRNQTNATVILQESETRVQRYAKGLMAGSFTLADAPVGDHVAWAFTDDGLFAAPKAVTLKALEPSHDELLTLERGARLTIDASGVDRHLRCDIRLPSGQSLERILVGLLPTFTVPAGPIEISLEEIDGEWSTTFALNLKPGETLTRAAR